MAFSRGPCLACQSAWAAMALTSVPPACPVLGFLPRPPPHLTAGCPPWSDLVHADLLGAVQTADCPGLRHPCF